MDGLSGVLGLLLAAATPLPTASPTSPITNQPGPVFIFLVDNSASLPPLDPEEKRVTALDRMFAFIGGHPHRLVLFGGRREIYVDDPARYRNNGQWTDFYFAFEKAKAVVDEYPAGTAFRIILLTDAILDPAPEDWTDMAVPPGEELKAFVVKKTLDMVGSLGIPLYVILVGDPPPDNAVPGSHEQAPALVLDLARVANGPKAAALAQTISSFFEDDGVLFKKFIFRVPPREGLKAVGPIVKRIAAPARPAVELRLFSYFVFPLLAILVALLGLLVRSFPGPGDVEIVELALGVPTHVAADRAGGGILVTTGLSLTSDVRAAAATLGYEAPTVDLSGAGISREGLDLTTQYLLPLGVEDLQRALETYADDGTREEKIFALNLDYVAKNMAEPEAERILTEPGADRRATAVDFLRAKAHLIGNNALRYKLTGPRLHLVTYGRAGLRKDIVPPAPITIGRYGFVVREVAKGGRKDVRVSLHYDRVPSLLGLKTLLPDAFQQVFRFRRRSARVVA